MSIEKSIFPALFKCQNAQITQNLQLLANFVFDVAIFRVDFSEFPFQRVQVLQVESSFAQTAHHTQSEQRPAALFSGLASKRQEALETLSDFGNRLDNTIIYDGNLTVTGNVVETDIAAYPTSASCRRGKRRTFLNHIRNEKAGMKCGQGANQPFFRMLQKAEGRSFTRRNKLHHRFESSIQK